MEAAEGDNNNGAGQQQQQGFWDRLFQSMIYFCVFNIVMNAGQWMALKSYAKNSTNATASTNSAARIDNNNLSNKALLVEHSPGNHNLLWPLGSQISLEVIIKEGTHCNSTAKNLVLAHWTEQNIFFSSEFHEANHRNATFSVPVSQNMINNKTSLFAHVYLTKSSESNNDGNTQLHKCIQMTKYQLRKKDLKLERSLMEHQQQENATTLDLLLNLDPNDTSILATAARNTSEDVTLMYIKPSLTLQMIVDTPSQFKKTSIPEPISKHMDFLYDDDKVPGYYPIFYPCEFWLRQQDMIPVNGTLSNVSLNLNFYPIKMWKWQLMSQMEETWRTQEETGGAGRGGADLIRTLLMDTNPWLLAVTAVVSLLHTAFDILAFKNDIKFFKGKKSMEGISLKSMIINAFFQTVIFFYLLDNSTDTSYMVLMSNAFALLIEFWKISKAFTISFCSTAASPGANNTKRWITWEEAGTYKNSKTKEYDEIATSHLLYISMPLVGGYGVYSLFHQKHKGWYSWILNTMVGFIYMFGFVMMTPQLFINYKLKSVAHLNWRTMTYKSINTFIDDLFAFVIKMPLMHRLACLRDDLIFFIFLYQRWIYRVDYTRVNEFGQCATQEEEAHQDSYASSNISTNTSVVDSRLKLTTT
eukprot:CAMPEP_0172431604 /NCGR_PEP_ID=MMETSP1064-20121228/59129_1 /TAXON_ID=202472 /ORGANISM="Aulacoseira subarctica , Strain CCAP 1002/5" /LENGTH=641 /DNA_ID=CAMNT_0013178389 /DNA_START=81 /DNA_END=2002 /DNA_ORIENTATION=+